MLDEQAASVAGDKAMMSGSGGDTGPGTGVGAGSVGRRAGRLRQVELVPPGPISAALDVRTAIKGDEVRRVLKIVDRVHTVGALPHVPIDHVLDTPLARAQYRYQANRGRALGIGLDAAENRTEIILIHEVGHFLDHQVLGRRGGFASKRHGDLAEWRHTVAMSNAYIRLQALRNADTVELTKLLGPDAVIEARITIDYLVDYTEVWARSYAHYVARKSGDPVLLRQLAAERTEADEIDRWAFWDEEDFLPIIDVIDDLFRRKGWLS